MRSSSATSASRGTLSRIKVCSVSRLAIISGSVAFFAPEIGIVPLRVRPPTIRMRSMLIPCGPCPDQTISISISRTRREMAFNLKPFRLRRPTRRSDCGGSREPAPAYAMVPAGKFSARDQASRGSFGSLASSFDVDSFGAIGRSSALLAGLLLAPLKVFAQRRRETRLARGALVGLARPCRLLDRL